MFLPTGSNPLRHASSFLCGRYVFSELTTLIFWRLEGVGSFTASKVNENVNCVGTWWYSVGI